MHAASATALPACICVDGVFYLVTSTFLYFPGIPVYTSRDLKTWTQIGAYAPRNQLMYLTTHISLIHPRIQGNVISRSTQLDFSACRLRPGTQFSGGIWAPTIRHRAGVFYVVTTLVFPDKAYDDFSRWQNVRKWRLSARFMARAPRQIEFLRDNLTGCLLMLGPSRRRVERPDSVRLPRIRHLAVLG